jgi:hypothetical protein
MYSGQLREFAGRNHDMIFPMDDWEHPAEASLRTTTSSGGNDIAQLQQQLSAALERIAALEERVRQLEELA